MLIENIKKGGFTHVLAGHSAFGKNLMPRVAALLDTQQISDITGVEGKDSKRKLCEDEHRDVLLTCWKLLFAQFMPVTPSSP